MVGLSESAGDLVLRPFRVRLRIPFRGATERRGVLVGGPAGWGEFSPFPDYPPGRAARWWRAALEAASQGWPPPVRTEVEVNAIVPAVPPERAHELARTSGCRTVKVKVASGDDEARVAAVRDALGPEGRIRVDANGAWDLREATRALRSLSRYGLEYAEQPVATLEDMARLRRLVDVPLAADESVRTAEDPLRVAGLEAADVVVLKVAPLGGVRACLRVAEACGLPCVVSSALETSVGLAAGLALACALPELHGACGLGTGTLLAHDVTTAPLLPRDGRMRLRAVVPEDVALERVALSGAEARAEIHRLELARAAG